MKKILVLTEMNFKGSGYFYLMSPILQEIAENAEYDIKVIGLSYDGSEHTFKFGLTPANTVQDGIVMATNIIKLWRPDVFVCGLDIPLQIMAHEHISKLGVKYIAITPLENPPLTQTWAAYLMMMDWVFFISELGKQAALQAGLTNTDHLKVGVDTEAFYSGTPREKLELREAFGLTDEFVVLTVADNQERKNLWAEFEILSEVKKAGKKIKFILVTREFSPVGYKLKDLTIDYGLIKETIIIERGLSQVDLRKLYVMSDLYLSTSKAEGLGIPILEAMACGLPIMATDTGAITELLSEGRGFLIEPEYKFRDVWGNSWRHMINCRKAAEAILDIMDERNIENGENMILRQMSVRGLGYAMSRTFKIPANQLKTKIEEFTDERKQEKAHI